MQLFPSVSPPKGVGGKIGEKRGSRNAGKAFRRSQEVWRRFCHTAGMGRTFLLYIMDKNVFYILAKELNRLMIRPEIWIFY